MQTNQTPEALAEEIKRMAETYVVAEIVFPDDEGTPPSDEEIADARQRLHDAINRLRDMAASGAKDAERWNEALRHVGGARGHDGIERFSLRTIRPLGDVTIYRGSVAEHFTKAIDAAIDATKRGGA